jgi:hypothetical protein
MRRHTHQRYSLTNHAFSNEVLALVRNKVIIHLFSVSKLISPSSSRPFSFKHTFCKSIFVLTIILSPILCGYEKYCRSQWPCGLRHEMSSPARTLRSCVRIPLLAWMCVHLLHVQVEALRRAVPPSKEPYRLRKGLRNSKSSQGSTKGCRATYEWMNEKYSPILMAVHYTYDSPK